MTANLKILIMDEEPSMLELYSDVLDQVKIINVVTCCTRQEALDLLQKKFDLILINGCKHLELIRTAQSLQSATPIIFSSGSIKSLPETLLEADLQVFGVLRKPFDICNFQEITFRALGLTVMNGCQEANEARDVEAR